MLFNIKYKFSDENVFIGNYSYDINFKILFYTYPYKLQYKNIEELNLFCSTNYY